MQGITNGPHGLDTYTKGYEYFGIHHVTIPAGQPIPGTRPAVHAPADLTGCVYREWAPGAVAVALIGEFNAWNPHAAPCTKDCEGVWTVFIQDTGAQPAIRHGSYVKLAVVTAQHDRAYHHDQAMAEELGAVEPGHAVEQDGRLYAPMPNAAKQGVRVWDAHAYAHKIPAWIRYAKPDPDTSVYCGIHWDPPAGEKHAWQWTRPLAGTLPEPLPEPREALTYTAGSADGVPALYLDDSGRPAPARCDVASTGLRVYEAHVGMATQEHRVGTYTEFARDVLPRVVEAGYNAVQFMAIQEHPYYASFGYHVTSFFAPTSRCGTPEDFKLLVDEAHQRGLLVIMDIVHSHACANVADGLNELDGTDHCYFHEGGRGRHDQWGSRLFNYAHPQVQRFLLSNLRYWMEEYRIDGFRFDGVTSMLYKHHGIGVGFSGDYTEYFGDGADHEAAVYLMLANTLLHAARVRGGGSSGAAAGAGPDLPCPAISIAEDVSGQPGLARPTLEGGCGFDFRLSMAVPDEWIKTLKHKADEDWDLAKIVHTLCNRRWQEKTIGYAESHDQALVGDKTIMMWLCDKEMYDHMSTLQGYHPVIARGIALHKMIRLLTCCLAVGNEWGHPEWIDFPREGNGNSFQHARRQWNLVDDRLLRFRHLYAWEVAMLHLDKAHPWLIPGMPNYVSVKHEGDKVVVAERGSGRDALVFVFNFHPTNSFTGYQVPVPESGTWYIATHSDMACYGGFDAIDASVEFNSTGVQAGGRQDSVLVYLPSRTCMVLAHRHGAHGRVLYDAVQAAVAEIQ